MRAPLLLAALLILSNVSALAQEFRVTEAVPAPGDSSVAMETTVSFTFIQPVDTSARFADQGPLAFYLKGGDSLRIDSSYVSEDLMTFSFDVTHLDTSDYVWILSGATSESGAQLCPPFALTYSTRSGWGGGIVRGETYTLYPTKSTHCNPYVPALLDARPDSSARIVASVSLDEWSFRFEGLRPGTYWPVVFMDWDGDGIINPDWDEAGYVTAEVAFYDDAVFGGADSVVVTDTTNTHILIESAGPGSVEGTELPGTARLLHNYPNPFRGTTTLAFEIERPLHLSLTIHDVLGRRVATVAKGFYQMGSHEINWSPSSLASGIYLVRMEAGDFALTRQMLHLGSAAAE